MWRISSNKIAWKKFLSFFVEWLMKYQILINLPSWLVKSPPWSMKSLMTRWKIDPPYPSGLVLWANSKKFLTVLGTVLPKSPTSIVPTGSPPMVISKETLWVTLGPFPSADSASKGKSEKIKKAMPQPMKIFMAVLAMVKGTRPPDEEKKSCLKVSVSLATVPSTRSSTWSLKEEEQTANQITPASQLLGRLLVVKLS